MAKSDPAPDRRKASQVIVDDIRTMIANGELVPGDALAPESGLMAKYEVARPTIREAIRILESDGLVRIQRGVGGGPRVLPFDVGQLAQRAALQLRVRGADFKDLREAQRVFEPASAALAATRRSERDLGALWLCIERAARCESLTELAGVVSEFHLLILRATGNKTIALVAEMLERIVRAEYQAEVHGLSDTVGQRYLRDIVTWYTGLVELIEAQDAVGAAEYWGRFHEWADRIGAAAAAGAQRTNGSSGARRARNPRATAAGAS